MMGRATRVEDRGTRNRHLCTVLEPRAALMNWIVRQATFAALQANTIHDTSAWLVYLWKKRLCGSATLTTEMLDHVLRVAPNIEKKPGAKPV